MVQELIEDKAQASLEISSKPLKTVIYYEKMGQNIVAKDCIACLSVIVKILFSLADWLIAFVLFVYTKTCTNRSEYCYNIQQRLIPIWCIISKFATKTQCSTKFANFLSLNIAQLNFIYHRVAKFSNARGFFPLYGLISLLI